MKLPNGYGSITKLSGSRRRPYMVRKTAGWHIDEQSGKQVQELITIGYAKTRAEGLQMLAEYNRSPYDVNAAKITFREVYEKWSAAKFPTASKSYKNSYTAAYKVCASLENRVFRDLHLADLQYVIDTCGKNYPTLEKVKSLFSLLYGYAMRNEICSKDYSSYVDILPYKDKNPDKREHTVFTREEVARLWELKDDPFWQIILMLIYNGCRISEFLNLKKENVHLDEQYFDVIASKTKSGIRKVPIADKVLPFYKSRMENSGCEYLLESPEHLQIRYANFYDRCWIPMFEQVGMSHMPHDTRHTCITLMTEAHVDPVMIKKIVGHAGAMSLTERVYTHPDIRALVDAINMI